MRALGEKPGEIVERRDRVNPGQGQGGTAVDPGGLGGRAGMGACGTERRCHAPGRARCFSRRSAPFDERAGGGAILEGQNGALRINHHVPEPGRRLSAVAGPLQSSIRTGRRSVRTSALGRALAITSWGHARKSLRRKGSSCRAPDRMTSTLSRSGLGEKTIPDRAVGALERRDTGAALRIGRDCPGGARRGAHMAWTRSRQLENYLRGISAFEVLGDNNPATSRMFAPICRGKGSGARPRPLRRRSSQGKGETVKRVERHDARRNARRTLCTVFTAISNPLVAGAG